MGVTEWETPIHVVQLKDGWICEKIAERLAQEIPGSTVGPYVDEERFNVFVPYILWNPDLPRGLGSIALFTHREVSNDPVAIQKRQLFDLAAKELDGAWCMSRNTEAACDFEIPTMVQPLAADDTYERGPLVLGVACREYSIERKNLPVLDELAKLHNVRISFTGGALPDSLMASWMSAIDYLVVTGQVEGGPMPVLEAMRMHKPVMAPDVGWCWDYPVIRYESDQQLCAIVAKLANQPGWDYVARQVKAFCVEVRKR